MTYCLILCRKTCYVDELESYKMQKHPKHIEGRHGGVYLNTEHIISATPRLRAVGAEPDLQEELTPESRQAQNA